MKLKKKDLVKIYFNNGTTVDGWIKKWNKKKAIIKTLAGCDLMVFSPSENIMMVLRSAKKPNLSSPQKEIKITQPVEEQSSNEPKYTTEDSSPLAIEIGMMLGYRDGSRWEITDTVHEFVTLKNTRTGEQICPFARELRNDKGWHTVEAALNQSKQPQLNRYEEYSEKYSEKKSVEQPYQPDISLRSKELVNLYRLKRKSELESTAKQINNFIPNDSLKVTKYELPDLSKPIPPYRTTSQISRSS